MVQLERVWPEAGPGMVGPLERKRLGCTSVALSGCMVDLRKGPLDLVEHHTSRDDPCSLAGRLVAAWETGPRRYSLPTWLQPRHLRMRTRDRRPVDVPEKSGHMSSLLPRRPGERVFRMTLR